MALTMRNDVEEQETGPPGRDCKICLESGQATWYLFRFAMVHKHHQRSPWVAGYMTIGLLQPRPR